jgi:hypothetical protein
MEEIDLWRVARLLMEEHGYDDALGVAAGRAADLALNGDETGALVFKAICECIREMGPGARRRRRGERIVRALWRGSPA